MKTKHIIGIVVTTLLFSTCDKPETQLTKEVKEDYTETAFGLNMEMVYVEGGTFEMGGTAEQGNAVIPDELPVRNVRMDSYHIGRYEVTQAQWKAVMGTTVEDLNPHRSSENTMYWGEGDDFPMYYITSWEAQKFCKLLSQKTGKKYMIPTEAQWEYAARGGNKSQHFKYAGSNNIDEVAWCYGVYNCELLSHPVGMKKANELGIYDMSGNVSEFCSDRYTPSYDASDTVNPQSGVLSNRAFVMRGGDYYHFSSPAKCRVSYRDLYEESRDHYIGFRIACIPK